MKITDVADLHLNISLYKGIPDKEKIGLPFRTVDFMKSFEWIVTNNINVIKPDLMVISGDVYDSFAPPSLVSEFFNAQISKLGEAGIKVICIVGNHDLCRIHHSLMPLNASRLPYLRIYQSPKMIEFKDKILMLFPYSMEVESKKIAIRDQFYDFIKECKEKISKDTKLQGKEIFFFGHFGVNGAVANKYTEKLDLTGEGDEVTETKLFINRNKDDISLGDLDEIGASYVFLGDYHKHQVLDTKKCIAMYSGSIERTDISEAGQSKGFIVYDSEAPEKGKMGKCRFIEYPNCRPLVKIQGNMSEIETQFNKTDESDKGAIIKISFKGNSEELMSFSLGMENLKKKIKSKLDPVHVFTQQKVIDAEEEEKATKLEEEIQERGHVSNSDVLDVVGEMIKEKVKEEDEIKELLKMADDVYKEAMEGAK